MTDGIGRKVVSGIKWTVIYKITAQLINWLSTLWVVRLLMPSDYGLNAMLEAPLDLAMVFATWGMQMALVQRTDLRRETLSAVFGFMLLINFIAFLAFQLMADEISSFFREPRLTPLMQVIGCVFLMVPFRIIPNAILDQKMRFKVRAQVDLGASILGAITSVVMALAGAGVWALVGSVLVNYIVRSVVLAILQPWFVLPSLRFDDAYEHLKLGAKVLAGGILVILTAKCVEIIAGPSVGAQTLGLFAVASQLAMLPISRILPIVNQTLYPAYVHIQNDNDRVRLYLLKSIQYAGFIIVPSALGLAISAEEVIDIFFGDRWGELNMVLPTLCLLLPIAMVRNLLTANLVALGWPNLQLKLYAITLVVTALLCYLLRERGLPGLVLIHVIATTVGAVAVYLACRHALGIYIVDIVRNLSPSILGTLIMLPIVLGVREFAVLGSGWLHLLLMIISGVIAYIAAIGLVYPEVMRDLNNAIRQK